MNQYMGKVLKSWMMLFAISFALAGTATLSSCSSDDDPFSPYQKMTILVS